jgi:hypothetical protein
VAASKAVLEALCRRLAAEHPGSRVNALRARQVDTAGYQEMFGPEVRDVVGRFSSLDVTPQEVGGVAAALCSGDLDGLSGQVVTVDRGASPLDNLVNVAPGLLGLDRGERVPLRDTATGGRAPGILWIDAGVAPPDASLDRAVDVVPADEALALPDERIPDSVVVGCDWTGRPADDVGPATLLPELLERAGATGPYPRYGIRLDLAPDPPSPGEALARTLDRYWAGWRAPGGPSLNAVRYSDEGLRPQALSAVRALLSGGMDAVRGQVLPISCGAVS